MDIPIQQLYEIVATPSNREVIAYSFQNHTYRLHRGRIEPRR